MIGTARKAEWGLPCQHGPSSRISCVPKHIQTFHLSTDHTRNQESKRSWDNAFPSLPTTVNYQHSVTAHRWILLKSSLAQPSQKQKLMVGTWNGSFIIPWGAAVKLVMVCQVQLLPSAATASLLQFVLHTFSLQNFVSKIILIREFLICFK